MTFAGGDSTTSFRDRIGWDHVVLALIIIGLIAFLCFQRYQHIKELKVANEELMTSEEKLKRVADVLDAKKKIVDKLTEDVLKKANRVKELEAVGNKARDDIKAFILKYHKIVPTSVAEEIAATILNKSAEHGVPFVAVLAVMKVESAYNPYAISQLKKDPARGLMQVRFGVWGEKLKLKSKYDLHDIDINIDSGCRILRIYLDETKNDMKKALYKYVGGNAEYAKKVYETMGKFVVFRSFNIEDSVNGNIEDVLSGQKTGQNVPIKPNDDKKKELSGQKN
jgi:hypothetical protein